MFISEARTINCNVTEAVQVGDSSTKLSWEEGGGRRRGVRAVKDLSFIIHIIMHCLLCMKTMQIWLPENTYCLTTGTRLTYKSWIMHLMLSSSA